jgi:hypothetical protein
VVCLRRFALHLRDVQDCVFMRFDVNGKMLLVYSFHGGADGVRRRGLSPILAPVFTVGKPDLVVVAVQGAPPKYSDFLL